MKRLLSILFFIFLGLTLAADYVQDNSYGSEQSSGNTHQEVEDMVMTRNLDPENHPVGTYEDYLATLPQDEPNWHQQINYRQVEGRPSSNFLIIVRSTIHSSIQTSLDTYQSDLLNENISSILVEYAGFDHVYMKSIITGYYASHSIVGVILIGMLPVAWYEYELHDNDGQPNGEWDQFPLNCILLT